MKDPARNILLVLFSLSSSPISVFSWLLSTSSSSSNPRPKSLRLWSQSPPLRELYPSATATNTGTLAVDEVHTLSYQVYGNPNGWKALFLHGGPGAGCFPNHARFFGLTQYQVILLDQRGCGKSTPSACLINQTLHHLVQDCEVLRQHLQIPQWDVVLGGSWGCTVAIAYAKEFPQSLRSMILRGICLLRPQEVDWLFATPRAEPLWKAFQQAVGLPAETTTTAYPREVLHEYYQRLILGDNETERWEAARAWMQWEFYNSVAYQLPPTTNLSDSNATRQALQSYQRPPSTPVAVWQHGSWTWRTANNDAVEKMAPNDLEDANAIQALFRRGLAAQPTLPREPWPFPDTINEANVSLPIQAILTCYYSTNDDYCRNYRDLLQGPFPSIPCIAIQGGSDGICPPDTALDLVQVWPTLELRIPKDAGHSMYDPFLTHELVQATDRLARLFQQQHRVLVMQQQ